MQIEKRPESPGSHDVGVNSEVDEKEEGGFARAAREIYQAPPREMLVAQNEDPVARANKNVLEVEVEPKASLPPSKADSDTSALAAEKPVTYRSLKGGRRAENDEERVFENKLQSGELFNHYTKLTSQLADKHTKFGAMRDLVAAGAESAPAVYQALRSPNKEIAEGSHEVMAKLVAQSDPRELFDSPELANFWRVQRLDDNKADVRRGIRKDITEIGTDTVPALIDGMRSKSAELRSSSEAILYDLVGHAPASDLSNNPELIDYIPQVSPGARLLQMKPSFMNEGKQPADMDEVMQLLRHADFLRANPEMVSAKIDRLTERNKQISEHPELALSPEEQTQNSNFISGMQIIDRESAGIRLSIAELTKDPVERRKLAVEALKLYPAIVDSSSSTSEIRSLGLFKDPEFAEVWEKSGGDPEEINGANVPWEQVAKSIELRLELARKFTGAMKKEGLESALESGATRCEQRKQFGKAAAYLSERLELVDEDKVSSFDISRLASLYKSAGDKSRESATLEKLVKRIKESPERVIGIAAPKVYERLEQLADTDEQRLLLAEEAIKRLDPDRERPEVSKRHRDIAVTLERLKEDARAEEHLRQAIQNKRDGSKADAPWLTEDFMALGEFLKKRGREEEAVPYFKSTMELTENSRFAKEYDVAASVLLDCYKKLDPSGEKAKALELKIAERNARYRN